MSKSKDVGPPSASGFTAFDSSHGGMMIFADLANFFKVHHAYTFMDFP